MTQCHSNGCDREAVTAIKSVAPRVRDYGLATTIYQILSDDVPDGALPYCAPCAIVLAAEIAALADSDVQVQVQVSTG